MNTSILTEGIKNTRIYRQLLCRLIELQSSKKKLPLLVEGVSDGALYSLTYSLISDIKKETGKPVLILIGEERRANKLNEFFKKCSLKSELYPVRDFNFYDITASHELEHERLKVLCGLALNSLDVVLATPDALLQYTMPKKALLNKTISINSSTPLDISQFSAKLFSMGYTNCETVESPGQYSIRGFIVDIFPTKCEYVSKGQTKVEQSPIRIELFGDDIDRMATFDVLTQRTIENIDSFTITPSKEIIASSQSIQQMREEITTLLSSSPSENARTELEKELGSLEDGSSHPFFDRFISLIYPEKECLVNYFDENSCVIFCDTASVRQRASEAQAGSNEIVTSLIESGILPSHLADFSAPVSLIDKFAKEHQSINIDPFIMSHLSEEGGIYNFQSKGISFANHSLGVVIDELKYFVDKKYKTVLVCQTETESKSSIKTLNEMEIPAYSVQDRDFSSLKEGGVGVICDSFPDGYEIPDSKFALVVLSSRSLTQKKKSFKNKPYAKNAGEKIMSHADLNVGDYVVHVSYGIGKYLGIENLCIMGAKRDYIAIQYAGTDKLFLPVDQLDMVAKYIGAKSSDGEVRLSKMGGADWTNKKQKAKTAAREMAKELIDLYARRTRIDGFSFLPDEHIEGEFASSFEHEETDSQLQAIQEIKEDMEKPYPMDRVLCGDVGYGKTEVAFRAAMKAVVNNKQVAILVPTTILAMQHYQTALARFAGTGVNIEMISRFRTASQQSLILRKLKRGDVDIIIGTHKLLSSKIEFKDLGLLIVDEEQRFGVAQKEKIKQLVPDVDVLTLSATPIPRTLSMAMGGIRDLSVLDESPSGRVGVQSYVLEYDRNIINDAIKRELHRGGQVFYLQNNVEETYRIASHLRTDFPEANIAVAHGQMERTEIESIWQSLVNGSVDILVSTTIIETGIDIPNANTLIIENADKMGLSQLHQIRGRVGRSHRRAYAFFTYRRGKQITEIAQKRLSAIRDFAEFGAGFKIAMRDLEIRGAGNLLGAQQHGHLDAVGYDLYIRLLNEAVLEERGESIALPYETKITTSEDAYIPKTYIKSASVRMEIYKKIAHITNEADKKDIEAEITDRFGKMPPSARMLTSIALIKAYASRGRIKRVEQLKGEFRLYPEDVNLPVFVEISKYDRANVQVCGVGKTPYFSVKMPKDTDFSQYITNLLRFYIQKTQELV
ncbi:MAG: transcription-repair coupling factor [Ruminococcaceae bacterium]|nr:transcription-repair coupling factor [Oscillospiraceae bacterium]